MTKLTAPVRRRAASTRTRCTPADAQGQRRARTSATCMGVASIVLDDGGSEDEAIGALLHDAAEDHGGRARLEEIRAPLRRAGRHASSRTAPTRGRRPSGPGSSASATTSNTPARFAPSSLRVAAADKVHNAYAILRDLRNTGEEVWDRFNAPADDVIAYYEGLVRAFRAGGRR